MSPIEEVLTKDLPPPSSPRKGTEQIGVAEKEKENPKEVAPKITKSSAAHKDSSEGGVVSQNHELVLANFSIPTKKESKGKGPASSVAAIA